MSTDLFSMEESARRDRYGPESRAGRGASLRVSESHGKERIRRKVIRRCVRWDRPISRRSSAYKTTQLSSQSDAVRTSFRCAGPDLPAKRIRPRKPSLFTSPPILVPPPPLLSLSILVLYYILHKINLI